MQSVFLVKIHEALNSLTSVHFSLYYSVNSPGKYTKTPALWLSSAGISACLGWPLAVRERREEKTFLQWEEGSERVDFSEFN